MRSAWTGNRRTLMVCLFVFALSVVLSACSVTAMMLVLSGGYLPSRAGASVWGSAGAVAADASAVARWGYLLYGGHVITSDLVSQMITSPAGEVMGSGPVGYGLGTMTLEDPLIVGHAGCGGDIYSTQLLVWPGSATAVAILTPQQNDGDFTFEYELASALAGKANM